MGLFGEGKVACCCHCWMGRGAEIFVWWFGCFGMNLIFGLNGGLDQDFEESLSDELRLDSECARDCKFRERWGCGVGWDAMMSLRRDTCFCL
jgi:hypothetical protein